MAGGAGSAVMMAVGGKGGGGRCNRSITVLATCAAVRIVSGAFAARGLRTRRAALPADFVTDFGAGARLRTLGLAMAAGFGRTEAAAPAASTFLRACFAAFFSAFNDFRACFSSALAVRTLSFAAAARAAAFAAAALSRFIVAG